MVLNNRMARASQSAEGWPGTLREALRHPAMVPTVFCAGVALSLLAFALVRDWERTLAGQKAADMVHEQLEKLQETGLRSMEVLYSVASLHEAQGEISRSQFHQFVQQALARQPELRALSWNPRVPDSARQLYESAARADGVADFKFLEMNGAARLVPAARRSEYVPVYYIEPLEGNTTVLGYDLSSDVSRRQSLEQACDSGQPVATAPIHLAQETDHRAGLLVLLPVYRGQTPGTQAERRELLVGYAVAVFRVADLVGRAFDQLEAKGIHARLFDESAEGELIYAGAASASERSFTEKAPQISLQLAGRRWVVEFAATPAFTAARSREQSFLVLMAGLGLTLLLTAHLNGGWRRTREIAAANALLQEEVAVRQKAEAVAAAANQAKSDFLASMSHEIRTPLNAILGYTQLLQHDPNLSAEQRDAISGIGASGQHLIGLINEILDLSKIEAGRMELNPVDFDLAALGRSLLATFHPLCAQKRIGLRLVNDATAPNWVHGDEGKLRQVLINLLGNAVKFTRAGEVYLRFKAEEGGHWRFEVVDTGLGIPAEEQADIFKPFHQGRNAAHQGGTGLGLAIARRQVDLLGGRLELQSERGIGSRFHFQILLPAATGVLTPAAPALGLPRLKPGQLLRTLVVDDRKENRDVLGGMLARAGCEVAFAANGGEALELAPVFHPQLVFLDWLMPGLDGAATTRTLLSDPACGPLKIVVHSAAATPQNRERAQEAGCVDFVAKPIQADQVYECLRLHSGAQFDYAEPPPVMETPPAWEGVAVGLPEALHARLLTAAELHSTTALKSCLQDLRQIGPEGRMLAEQIRHLMRSYDMNGILRLLCQVTSPARASASPSQNHDFAST